MRSRSTQGQRSEEEPQQRDETPFQRAQQSRTTTSPMMTNQGGSDDLNE